MEFVEKESKHEKKKKQSTWHQSHLWCVMQQGLMQQGLFIRYNWTTIPSMHLSLPSKSPSLGTLIEEEWKSHTCIIVHTSAPFVSTTAPPFCKSGAVLIPFIYIIHNIHIGHDGVERTFCHTPGVLTPSDLPAVHFDHYVAAHYS